jgi:protein-tyrosine phosphatase
MERHLDWPGCVNVRDLGGLPLTAGGVTAFGGIVRADSLDRLTPAGWERLHAYGIRTAIDLREADERTAGVQRPEGITVVTVELDDNADSAFWYACADGDIDGTPLYYRPFLRHKADRCVQVLTAVAGAGPGGVVVHCGIGRDRTGLIALLILALAGVEPDAIVEDYALSHERLRKFFGRDDDPIADRLAERGTTVADTLTDLLGSADLAGMLNGLTAANREAVRARLVTSTYP